MSLHARQKHTIAGDAHRLQTLAVFKLNARLGRSKVVQAEAAYIQLLHVERLEQVYEIPAHGAVVKFNRNKADAQTSADNRGQLGGWKRNLFAAHFSGVEGMLVSN